MKFGVTLTTTTCFIVEAENETDVYKYAVCHTAEEAAEKIRAAWENISFEEEVVQVSDDCEADVVINNK